MNFKILVITHKSAIDENIIEDLIKNSSDIEYLSYESIEELPLRYDNKLYAGIIFLRKEIDKDIVRYIDLLRAEHNKHTIYVVGKPIGKAVYLSFAKFTDTFLFEASEFLYEQLKYIVQHLKNIFDTKIKYQNRYDKYLGLIQESPMPVLAVKRSGKIEYTNKAFLKLFKYEPKLLSEVNLENCVPANIYEEISAGFLSSSDHNSIYLRETTFLDGKQSLIPCGIYAVFEKFLDEPLCFLFLSDHRQSDSGRQELKNRVETFKEVAEIIKIISLTHELQFPLKSLAERIKKVFKSDFLLVNMVNDDETSLMRNQEDKNNNHLLDDFEEIILSGAKTIDVCLIHKNRFPAEKVNKSNISSIMILPLSAGDKLYGVITLFFVNPYEDQKSWYEPATIIGRIISLGIAKSRLISELSISRQNYREIVENALDGIYRSSPDGKILYANPALLKMLEYDSLEDLQQLPIEDALYRDAVQREQFTTEIEKNQKVRNYVLNLKTKNNRELKVIEHAHVITGANGAKFYEGIIRDITEYAELEKSLKNTQNFADELIEKASIIMNAFDSEGNIIIWNKKAEEITGYKKEEVLGRKDFLKKIYRDQSYYRYVMESSEISNKDNLNDPIEYTLTAKNGEEKKIRWTGMRIKSEPYGEVDVSFGVDMTETRRLEKRLLDAQKIETYSSISASIAEDFNQVLRSIIENVSNAKVNLGSENTLLKHLELIDESVHTGGQLTGQLLSLTQKSEPRLIIVDPNQIIEQSVNVIEHTIPEGIEMEAELQTRDYIMVDPAQLNQVILNLALNSVEAMPEGGKIVIRSESVKTAQEARLTENHAAGDQYVKISVSDTGTGMSDDVKNRLFEPFFSTKKGTSSKGLGLSLIYRVVSSHKGFIFFDSTIGKGTEFSLYFPTAWKNHEEEPKKQVKYTILVVDDESIIRDLIRDVLVTNDFDVLLADDGLTGLELFEKNMEKIDLVILDIIMPNMDGLALYNKIKKIKPSARVLITSGYSKSDVKNELVTRGIDGFLPKPFNIRSLMDMISNILK
ncbi:MAG: PAS domain S-box protein [Calditrichaceae bacterium]